MTPDPSLGRPSSLMHKATILLLVLALACESFAYWGLSTVSGRRAFDEMAGMIPLASGLLGVLFALGSAFTFWRSRGSATL